MKGQERYETSCTAARFFQVVADDPKPSSKEGTWVGETAQRREPPLLGFLESCVRVSPAAANRGVISRSRPPPTPPRPCSPCVLARVIGVQSEDGGDTHGKHGLGGNDHELLVHHVPLVAENNLLSLTVPGPRNSMRETRSDETGVRRQNNG